MATIMVSTAAELMAAAARARAGDTIALAAGNYDKVTLRNIKFAEPVTITSATPDKPAEINGLKAFGVENITFRNVVFADQDWSTQYDFEIKNAAKVSFDSVVIRGQDGDLGYQSNAFMVRDSRDVSITNSEITHLRYGINMLDNSGVTIKGNYFHDLRADGFHGGGLSNILIADNVFTNFRPWAGDHPDAIQFWTANQKVSAENITITGNVIHRGNGGAIQGIFMGDETNVLPYKNVSISNNLVVGGMFNGIHVERAEGLAVTDNIVAGYLDQASWIRIADVTAMTGNVAQLYMIDGKTVEPPLGNKATQAIYDQGSAFVGEWLAANAGWVHSAGNSPVLSQIASEFRALADLPPPPVPLTRVVGTDGADRLKAAAFGDSLLIGGKGNDQLTGGDGNTRMEGGEGDDVYFVRSARDLVVEERGGGNDTVYASIDYTLPDNVETLRMVSPGLTGRGNALDNRMIGTAGGDKLYGGAGNDSIQGLDGDDWLYGEAGKDNLNGGAGNDMLYGGAGADTLIGGEGNDRIWGGADADIIEGGAGNDRMSGGPGADTFLFRNESFGDHDVIVDFEKGDRISLSLMDANLNTDFNDAFRFVGTSAFTKTAGELRYERTADGVVCFADMTGDGVADLTISLLGVDHLTASAFLL